MVRLRPGSDLQQFRNIEIVRNWAPIPGRSGPGWGVLQEKPEGVPQPQAQTVRSLPEPTERALSPSASHTWPLPGTPGRGSPSPSRFLHSQEATTRFGLRGHLGRGHNESRSWPAAPIGRRRVGAGDRAPAEEAGRSRQPEGGGPRGCGRTSIPAESAAPPAHRAFLTPAPSSACAWHIQPSLSL